MANTPTYDCTRCGKKDGATVTEQRANLTAKKVMFVTVGEGPQTLKARIVAWLCNECRDADSDWQLESASGHRRVAG